MLDSQKKIRQNSFLIKFWIVAILLLTTWYFFLQIKKLNFISLAKVANSVLKVLPLTETRKEELALIFNIIPALTNGKEKTFLILFQDNDELRPGGGYINSFGILKIKDEKIISFDIHDTTAFDSKVNTQMTPPVSITNYTKVANWGLKDSNWSPDFATNAMKAEELYLLEGGTEEIAGVVAISTKLLPSFLEITGPISIPDFPGEYNVNNATEKLQFQLEKSHAEQNTKELEKKYVMGNLVKAMLAKIQTISFSDKKALAMKLEKHLNEKDVMINLKDVNLQKKIEQLNWNGELKVAEQDYLMMVDANLFADKTDQVMKRTFVYTVDFSQEKPRATLDITYRHNGKLKDWYIKDYIAYLRIFVPNDSWLASSENLSTIDYGVEQDKKFFGGIIEVPTGTIKTVSFAYDLPKNITFDAYKLLIQKQSGIEMLEGVIKIIDEKGNGTSYVIELKEDWEIER